MFRTAFSERVRMYQPTGEKVITEHRLVMDKDGIDHLVRDNKINIYERIQASAEQSDINNIVRRAKMGDPLALNQVKGDYMNVLGAPKNLREAQQFVINAERQFESLPLETKKAFDMNPKKYVSMYGTKEFEDLTGITAEKTRLAAIETANKEFEELTKKAITNLAKEGGTE